MDENILVVDDDPMVLSSHRRSLRDFSIETACGAWEALGKVLSGHSYAVVLSDLRMPEIDGLSLLRRVHDACPNTVSIILTGNPDLKTAMGAINGGNVFRYLEKPCPHDILVSSLEAALKENKRLISEKNLIEKASVSCATPPSAEVSLKRCALNSGDPVVVTADGLRQGQHGVVQEILPALGGDDSYQTCLIEFPSLPGRPKARYFLKELARA